MKYMNTSDGSVVEVTPAAAGAGYDFLATGGPRPTPLTTDELQAGYFPVGSKIGLVEQVAAGRAFTEKSSGAACTVCPLIDPVARERGSEWLVVFGDGRERAVSQSQLNAEFTAVVAADTTA
jgi:hypothetical protein